MNNPLSFDDIAGSETLCQHCSAYGVVRICEGISCSEAYENYLEEFEEEK